MRSLSKFSSYPTNTPTVIPFKLLKFKRSKWKKVKKIVKTKITLLKKRKQSKLFYKKRNKLLLLKKTRFYFFYGLKIQRRTMPNLKRYYKDCLITNRVFKQSFSNRLLTLKDSSKDYNIFFSTFFIKQFFKPEILLSKLHFFNSSEEALQSISNGSVLINLQRKKSNYVVTSQVSSKEKKFIRNK